jgi:hypothetical protein
MRASSSPEQQAALRIAHRIRHRDAVLRQVLHQPQVEGQLRGAQPFEQRQHIVVLASVARHRHEIVGVLDTTLDAGQRLQGAQVQRSDQGVSFVKRNIGVDSHGGERRVRALGAAGLGCVGL